MAHVVVKIGGCNGSGKTSVVRALFEAYDLEPQYDFGSKKISAYVAPLATGPQLVVLGSYKNVCGGMDTISDKDVRLALVKQYAKPGNVVIYEGLITGKTYGAMGALSEEDDQAGKWLYTFMNTPFAICVNRVLARRAAAGNMNPFDPERTMRPTFTSCERLPERVRVRGVHPEPLMLRHEQAPGTLAARVLKEALELYNAQ